MNCDPESVSHDQNHVHTDQVQAVSHPNHVNPWQGMWGQSIRPFPGMYPGMNGNIIRRTNSREQNDRNLNEWMGVNLWDCPWCTSNEILKGTCSEALQCGGAQRNGNRNIKSALPTKSVLYMAAMRYTRPYWLYPIMGLQEIQNTQEWMASTHCRLSPNTDTNIWIIFSVTLRVNNISDESLNEISYWAIGFIAFITILFHLHACVINIITSSSLCLFINMPLSFINIINISSRHLWVIAVIICHAYYAIYLLPHINMSFIIDATSSLPLPPFHLSLLAFSSFDIYPIDYDISLSLMPLLLLTASLPFNILLRFH